MKTKIKSLIEIFSEAYPTPETSLNFSSPFELLVATILSAQTTDVQVNKVTGELFKNYNTPQDFAVLEPEELAEMIKSIGLYRNKSKYVIKTSKIILEDYAGKVPLTRNNLMKLSGVGRKTANVVLANAFQEPAFPVDTHVFRVSNRIGIATAKNVRKTEKELTDNIPKNYWIDMHHWLIDHGRSVCKAQNPLCDKCPINHLCDYYISEKEERKYE